MMNNFMYVILSVFLELKACQESKIHVFIIQLHFVEYKLNNAQNEYKYLTVFVLQRTG